MNTMVAAMMLASAQGVFLAIAFFFLAIWFLLKLATDRIRTQTPPPRRPPRPLMRPDARPGPPRPLPPGTPDPRDEVAEFLRRAKERAQEVTAASTRPTASAPQARPSPQPPKRPKQPPAAPPRIPPVSKSPSAPPRPAEPPRPKRLEQKSLEDRFAPLAGSELTGRTPDVQVRQPVTSQLGTLSGGPLMAEPEPAVPSQAQGQPTAPFVPSAASIVEALCSGDRLREIVILNEILRPPSQNWD